MTRHRLALLIVVAAALPLVIAADDGFQDTFDVPKDQFVSTGKNAYFSLEPGYRLTFEGKEDGKKLAQVEIWTENGQGQKTTPGEAIVVFH